MILIKLNSNKNFKSLLIDFYLLTIVILLTILIIPEKSNSFSTDFPEQSDLFFKNNNKNEQENYLLVANKNSFLVTKRNKLRIKKTTKNSQLLRKLRNNNFAAESLMESNDFTFTHDYNNKTDHLNGNYFAGIDYIGYNQLKNNTLSLDDSLKHSNDEHTNHYWALILLLFPVSTIFGNILVVLSVVKEKNLRTVTNYFVVSLALADLTVAAAVMPFAVYYEVCSILGFKIFLHLYFCS